jgi:hypothetical protein
MEGTAQLDLLIDGTWAGNDTGAPSGFIAPKVTGVIGLRNVRATVRGVNDPIEISSAEVKLFADEARVEKLTAVAAKTRWTGSLALARGCGTAGACLVHFNLNAEEIGLSELAAALRTPPAQKRWYQVLSPAEAGPRPFLETLRASGMVSAGRVRIHGVVANRVSALMDLDRGVLTLSKFDADVMGGKHRGEWKADFSGDAPVYSGYGTVKEISLEKTAEAMHDPWITGTSGGSYQVKAAGADSTAFWQSAEGEVRFDLRNGTLAHISLLGDQPLEVSRWSGSARLHEGKIEIAKGQIESPAGTFELSGTATLGQTLDLKLMGGAASPAGGAGSLIYSITGTIAEPQVALSPAPETQAHGLKPPPKGPALSQR